MKRHLLATMILCGLLAFASQGWSLTIDGGATEVGALDLFEASALLPNSGYATELAWVQSVLGTDYTFTEADKYDPAGMWEAVDGYPDYWALELKDEPAYFFIKIGTGSLNPLPPDHYLFENQPDLGWGVIDLSEIYGGIDVGRISHVAEIAGVPEPATLLLLGSGLIGLWVSRRRLRKS